jgi:TRAP-type C4-dicarboxylate transport system substrate-binding protein
VMSRRAWDELTDEDRVIFRAAAKDSSRYMREQWLSWEERSRKQVLSAGVKIIEDIDRKAFVAATAPLREEMRKDSRFAPLIKRIEAVQ